MSNVSSGKKAEARGIRILAALGYELAARAKGSPVWSRGRVVANDGPTDLCRNSVDAIFRKHGRRTLFVQFTHVGSESPRRAKLRAVDWCGAFEEAHLWAWDADMGAFRVYRDVDGFLKGDGWYIGEGDTVFPWDAATRQAVL